MLPFHGQYDITVAEGQLTVSATLVLEALVGTDFTVVVTYQGTPLPPPWNGTTTSNPHYETHGFHITP
jgi:hypothetical protein